MSYTTTITFTMDTICPWTYLSLTRLLKALKSFKETSASASQLKTLLRFQHYQLYPDYPTDKTQNKQEWYTESYYKGDTDKVEKYGIVMGKLFEDEGLKFSFEGSIGNTLEAHRMLQWVQSTHDNESALKFLLELYRQYFTEGHAPSDPETLQAAMKNAGLSGDADAKKALEDKEVGLSDVKDLLRETKLDGVDSVPVVTFEGKRRDIGLVGCKSVEEYVKALETIAKESR